MGNLQKGSSLFGVQVGSKVSVGLATDASLRLCGVQSGIFDGRVTGGWFRVFGGLSCQKKVSGFIFCSLQLYGKF